MALELETPPAPLVARAGALRGLQKAAALPGRPRRRSLVSDREALRRRARQVRRRAELSGLALPPANRRREGGQVQRARRTSLVMPSSIRG
jgi:hypothetical protein